MKTLALDPLMAQARYQSFILALLLLTSLDISTIAQAQDITRIYSPDALRQAGRVYARNIQGMWEEDFVARLETEERRRAGSVTLFLPPVGENRHPLDYYSDPGTRRVFIPISSVKFLDDLSIALAYYQRQGCDLSTVSDYAALLRVRPDDVTDPPLIALGVPDDALEDLFVDDVSQKLLKSTLFFLAGHEYAHVMYGHKPYSQVTPDIAQAQEVEADAFALEVMRRIAVAPLALSQFFMIATRLESSPQDFQSDDQYRNHMQQSTHPISTERLEKVASNIENNLTAYANGQDQPSAYRDSLKQNVADLRQIARGFADPSMRNFLGLKVRDIDPAQLATQCRQRSP